MQDKAYGRAALVAGEEDTEDVMRRFRAVQEKVGEILEGVHAKPSLLHGDLWIGNPPSSLYNVRSKCIERHLSEVSLLGVETVLRLERAA